MQPHNHKPIPNSIAVFGAAGRSGTPLVKWLSFHAPHIRLRLIGSTAHSVALLRSAFPHAEVVQADYLDRASLHVALAGIEGLYVITRELVPEEIAMGNLVAAVKQAGCLIHMIRITGLQPDANLRRIPQVLRDFRLGIEIQHELARQVLDAADMPVTYLNIGASMMDNFLRVTAMLPVTHTLIWPHRLIPYIDARELGEAAGRLLLSDNHRHLYQFYTINNGHDLLRTDQVVEMMSDVFQVRIHHDPSREGFFALLQPLIAAGLLPGVMPEYLWNFFAYEQENEQIWIPNQFLERLLGRPPITLRAYLQEHRHLILPQARVTESADAQMRTTPTMQPVAPGV